MEKKEKLKHILGYTVGILIFIVFIPSIIFLFSMLDSVLFNSPLINSNTIRLIIIIPLSIIGVMFVIWSNLYLFIKGEGGPTDLANVELSPRSKHLVFTGPYRYTRNPMVFGMSTLYFCFALFINSPTALIYCTAFLSIVIIYLKLFEEKRLLKDFGDEFIEYKKRVAMIIPFLKLK